MKKKLIEILSCPICGRQLSLLKEKKYLFCRFDMAYFPLLNGIPVLLKTSVTYQINDI